VPDLLRLVDGREIRLTNPDKVLWPDLGVTKGDYMHYLMTVAPYLLPYTRDRLLMAWRYPDGAGTERIEEKAVPEYAPAWVPRAFYKDKDWVLLNDAATLAWVANRAALELHVPFDRHDRPGYPTEVVFDLDPPDDAHFDLVREVALRVKTVLDSLALRSVAKTSGATGLQIYLPIEPAYTFAEARQLTEFVARYMAEVMPDRITLHRVVSRRGSKLYFDYPQLWKMRTMPAPYSARANAWAGVSAPVRWAELERGVSPRDFTVATMISRLQAVGDLFHPITDGAHRQSLREILAFIRGR